MTGFLFLIAVLVLFSAGVICWTVVAEQPRVCAEVRSDSTTSLHTEGS